MPSAVRAACLINLEACELLKADSTIDHGNAYRISIQGRWRHGTAAGRRHRKREQQDHAQDNSRCTAVAQRDEVLSRPERAQTARLAVFGRVLGAERVLRNRDAYLSTNPAQRAESATQTAQHARSDAELLLSLTPAEAVARIEQTRAAEAQQVELRRAALYDPGQHRATPGQAPPHYGRSL